MNNSGEKKIKLLLKDFLNSHSDYYPDSVYLEIYDNHDKVFQRIFSYFHEKMNHLFEFMNHKSSINNHYNADDSRELIKIIDELREMKKNLKETDYDFEINNSYVEQIKLVQGFLQGLGGSIIPEDFVKFQLVKYEPIFSFRKVKATSSKEVDNKNIIIAKQDNTSKKFETLEDVSLEIISKFNTPSTKQGIALLYAFNGTGKTRLSSILQEKIHEDKDSEIVTLLSYNAFFEDIFTWDNENCFLNFNPNYHLIKFIIDQGLENQITDNFQKLIQSKIFPLYDFKSGKITFSFSPGDDRSESNIKISRGEESLFVWSIFFTILEEVILILNEKQGHRETEMFDNLEYLIIDDPVSSIDDNKIITMSTELVKIIETLKNSYIKIVITTHHPLFFNVLYNELNRKSAYKLSPLLLSKNVTEYEIRQQSDDSPFSYHLVVLSEIKRALNENNLYKYHFNLFRGVLEKTANFLGYNQWDQCLKGERKKEIVRLIHHNSHGKLSDLESAHFPEEHKELLREVFNDFIEKFNWKI